MLKVPTPNHHHLPAASFNPQESGRCASAAGGYANSPFNNTAANQNHPRHASGSSAYSRGHLMVVPPDGGGGGGSNSYLSDSDLHIGSVSSSPGIRTKSISPTAPPQDLMFARGPPQHQPDLLFCPPITTSSGDFFQRVDQQSDGPLQLRKSPTANYAGGEGLWDGRLGGPGAARGGSVLAPVMDDFHQQQQQQQPQQQHTPSSPMSFAMRDNNNSSAGGDTGGGLGGPDAGGADSFQARQGKNPWCI